MKKLEKLKTFIINLPNRKDRLENILKEFESKAEFELTIVKAIKNTNGNVGLWQTMQQIIDQAKAEEQDVILICEDDHQFTEHYNKEDLFKNIYEAYEQAAHILLGGISGGFSYALPLTKSRIWIDIYFGNNFLILYKDFYDTFLNHIFDPVKTVDVTLSRLTMNKMILFPFISTQKNFGYSDVTKHNMEDPDDVPRRFMQTEKRLGAILKIYNYYYSPVSNAHEISS